MVPTPWIERASAFGTLAPALHVLIHGQNVLTRSAQHYFFAVLTDRPNIGFVVLACVMAADAGIEFVAAIVLDGNNIQRGVPVGALCEGRHGESMDLRRV